MKDINIDTLLKELQSLSDKGYKNIQILGTLLCIEDGNTIIASSERQM